jgi:hypothetical protein
MKFLEGSLATLDKNIENEKLERIQAEKSNIDEINNQLDSKNLLIKN